MYIWPLFKEWVYQNAIALDQGANTLLGGSADETLSCRCFRLDHILAYRILETGINGMFFIFQGPHHCRNSYYMEVLGRQLPYRFYDIAVAMNLRYDKDRLGNKVNLPDL